MADFKLDDIILDAFLTSALPSARSARTRVRSPASEVGVHQYIRDCNKYGAIPASQFLRHVDEDRFVMRFYGLGPLGAKAISRPLESNTHIKVLDLEGNCINVKGALYMASSLRDNVYITDMNLADNNLGKKGASAIIEMMRENATITSLDLSGNELSDRDGRIFFYLLKHNHALRELAIRHNNLGDVTASWLLEAFDINDTLRVLDISWNHFRREAAVSLARMLAENTSLREFHMSMNGLGVEGARVMGSALSQNTTLEVLDISANRIPTKGALAVASALQVNTTLKTLRMGRNPFSPVGALAVIQAVEDNPSSALELLDLRGVSVPLDFEVVEGRLLKSRGLKVVKGFVIAKREVPAIKVPLPVSEDLNAAYRNDPVTKLRLYCQEKQIRMLDLFKQFDKDQSWSVSREELRHGIKAKGIDLSEDDITLLLDKLDKDGDGDIDYKEICQGDLINKRDKIKVAQWNREQKQMVRDHYEAQDEAAVFF